MVGPLHILAQLLSAARLQCAYLKDEETNSRETKCLGAIRGLGKAVSGQVGSSLRERQREAGSWASALGAGSRPHPPKEPMTPERDAASVVITSRSLQTPHPEAGQPVPPATPFPLLHCNSSS